MEKIVIASREYQETVQAEARKIDKKLREAEKDAMRLEAEMRITRKEHEQDMDRKDRKRRGLEAEIETLKQLNNQVLQEMEKIRGNNRLLVNENGKLKQRNRELEAALAKQDSGVPKCKASDGLAVTGRHQEQQDSTGMASTISGTDSDAPRSNFQEIRGPSGRHFRHDSSGVKSALMEGTDAKLIPSTPSTSRQALLPQPPQGNSIGLNANPPASCPLSRGNHASTPYDERPVVGAPVFRARDNKEAGGGRGKQKGTKTTTLYQPYDIKKK